MTNIIEFISCFLDIVIVFIYFNGVLERKAVLAFFCIFEFSGDFRRFREISICLKTFPLTSLLPCGIKMKRVRGRPVPRRPEIVKTLCYFRRKNMSTTLVTKEQAAAARKWYVLDAAGKPMGKTAALAADLLRGKLKTDYTPHVDCGDYVIIINAKDAVLTGKKLEQKYYRTHSGYPGGLKETQYKTLMEKKPDLAMRLAVRGMLQKNTIAQWQLKRLRIFAGSEHTHAAQKPEVWDF